MASISLAANMDNFDDILDFVQSQVEKTGFSKKKTQEIRLACEEIIINIINYAYPDKKGNIEIHCDTTTRGGKGYQIKIIDWGIPFNPLSNPEPDTSIPIENREIGGLGIYLVRNVMDKIDYQRDGEKNILICVKYSG
jgi:anti-sigma regulatory factor (Ser/Thr protein kinase)